MDASPMRPPATAGPPTAIRTSSTVQATGWRTATAEAIIVRAIMSSRKARLPPLVASGPVEMPM